MVGCAMQGSSAAISQSSINLLSLDEAEMAGLVAGSVGLRIAPHRSFAGSISGEHDPSAA
jgi:hypothetical protein